MSYLLDTNHCSDIINGNPQVMKALTTRADNTISVSIITYAELLYMADKSERVTENRQVVENFLADVDVYLINEATATTYSRLKASLFNRFAPKEKAKRRGVNIGSLGFTDHDLWIVATAIQQSLTLVSADSDLQRIHQVQPFSLESWR
ncbi:MAG: type II toxin-antitoxin system VapC family toxin [Cyanobacteria bacterium REEB444]|nr:type II toxin-antitoxin system VapC family toxin [Cyanobacteria bacterium REEB444]